MGLKYIKATNIKKDLNKNKLWAGKDFFDNLEKEVKAFVDKAIARAKKNGRTTIMERDL